MFTSSNSTFPMNCNHRKPPPDPWALYVLAAVGALCFAVVLSMLTGCTTTRTVERVTVHRDTLHVVHRDTLRVVQRDTLRVVQRDTLRVVQRDTLRVVQRDTLRELRTVRDSVYLRDSIYLEGSTLVKERTRDRWHVRRDTVLRSRGDTVLHSRGDTVLRSRGDTVLRSRGDSVLRSRGDSVRAASHHTDTRNEKKTTHSGFLWPPLSLIVFLAVFGLIGYALKRRT